MGKSKAKPNYRRAVLRLPDLDHSKLTVLNSLSSPGSRRVYQYAIEQFIAWYCSEPRDSHKIATKLEVLTLSVEEAKKIGDSGWEAFGKHYSRCRGITLLSLPALNAEKDRALLYVGFSCGIVCGMAGFFWR